METLSYQYKLRHQPYQHYFHFLINDSIRLARVILGSTLGGEYSIGFFYTRKMRNTLLQYVMVDDAYASLGQCRRLHHLIKDENVKSITGETPRCRAHGER